MKQCVLLTGPSGAGKSTQSRFIVKQFGYDHISTGQLLRDTHPELTIGGHFADSKIVQDLLSEAISQVKADYILLDGFPRTIGQLEWFDDFLQEREIAIVRVLNFQIDKSISVFRLDTRDRSDDARGAVDLRWKLFTDCTHQVVEIYRARDLVVDIDANSTPDNVSRQIELALNNL